MKKRSVIIAALMMLLSVGVNAQRSINYDLNLKGNELHNAVINSFDSKAALDAHTVVGNGMLATVDGEPKNIYKYDSGAWNLVGNMSNHQGVFATSHGNATSIISNSVLNFSKGNSIITINDNDIILRVGGVDGAKIEITPSGVNINDGAMFISN